MTDARESKQKVEIPHVLRAAVKEGRAVVIFGAGASMECKASDGRNPPSADDLRNHLAQKFLGTQNETRDLATVAEMAIIAGAGEPQVVDEVARQFEGFMTSNAHKRLADFRWRSFATTNYDRFIEDGYAANSAALQTCVPFIKDSEPYEDRLREKLNPVPLLKLHGCLGHPLDEEVPLILSNEHYAFHEKGRDLLFGRLRDWAHSSVLIFIGYRLADPHIRELIYKIASSKRPSWFIVSPSCDEHDIRFWATKGVDIIPTTFAGFIDALDTAIPKPLRPLASLVDSEKRPYVRHLKNGYPSEELVEALEHDFDYVHASMSFDEVSAEKFYAGYDHGWCGIIRKYDFARKAGESLLFTAADEGAGTGAIRFYLLEGAAGSGKTIALRRAAFDAATALDQLVLWLGEDGVPRPEILEELYSLTGLRILLFVDHVSLHAEALERALHRLKQKEISVTIIASEREAEWETYCGCLNDFDPIKSTLRRLSEREAEDLVDLLERHGCLGQLATRSRAEQTDAFLSEERADRHLLVALHELTQGKPFEQIILDEYNRIHPDAACTLYLDIATMHQFGVTARAGAISRISGIRFSDFEADFLIPLKGIVRTTKNRFIGDDGYVARHAHVADIVFRVKCESDEERSAQLSRVIGGLDPGYSSDNRILVSICKGRKIAETFNSVASAREIFKAAVSALPNNAFLFQQAAIFEMVHPTGSLDRAEKLALAARDVDKINPIYAHTLAEVARHKANAAVSEVRAHQFRAKSRRYLNEISKADSYTSLTFCNLLIDEVIDLLQSLPEDPKKNQILDFNQKVGEAEKRLDKAKRDFPDEAGFPSAEGRLWQRLGEESRAKHMLQQAASLHTSNPGVFLRLARVESSGGELYAAIKTLSKGISRFPEDKQIHLELALRLIERDRITTPEIEGHFRASYGVGDHALDARFYHACYLFWAGLIQESQKLFDEVCERSSKDYRKRPNPEEGLIDQFVGQQTGMIASIKNDFFFIQSACYPKQIFAHASALSGVEMKDLTTGNFVRFSIRFNRLGPVATSVDMS